MTPKSSWTAVAERSGDTAFVRTKRMNFPPASSARKRRGAPLPAAVQDAFAQIVKLTET